MEMGVVNQFPLPIPPAHGDGQREIFTDYGSLGSVNVMMKDTIAQKSRGGNAQRQFYASRPSLPLFPPHHVPDPYSDTCMDELETRRESIVSALRTLTHTKSHVRKDSEHQRKLKTYLINLESRPAEGRTSDISNHNYSERGSGIDDDFLSRHYPALPELANTLSDYVESGSSVHKVNSQYTGGSLSCVSIATPGGHEAALVYASANRLSTVSISNILCNNYDNAVDENCISTVKMDGKIYEVVSQETRGKCYCAVRQKTKCSLFQMDLPDSTCKEASNTTTKLLQSRTWTNTEESPTSICLSPYLVAECAIATDNGNVYLWSCDGRFDEVCSNIEPRFSGTENWFSCHYGSHPREVIVSDRTGVSLFDVRQSKRPVMMDLFILPNRLLHNTERVMVSQQHTTNTFLHLVATDHNLVVIDERFPSSPVLFWSHILATPPQYIDVISGLSPMSSSGDSPGDDIVLLASQASHETHCFKWTVGTPPDPPHATATPWRVAQAEDFVHMSKRDGVLTDHSLLARLSVSLTGMCAVPRPRGDGFTVFQMTAHGDICHQTYQFGDVSMTDVTCAAGPGSDVIALDRVTQDVCTRWQKEERGTERMEDAATEWPLRKCHTASYYKGLTTETYPHVLCSLCMPQWRKTSVTTAATYNSEVCLSCGLSLQSSARLRETVHRRQVMSIVDDPDVEVDARLSTHDPNRFIDSTSKLLTKLWQEDYDVYDLLWKKEKEQTEKSQSPVVTAATETHDTSLDTPNNANNDHLLAVSEQVEPKTLVVRKECSNNPSDSTLVTPPRQQVLPRRRYLSTSSVDSVVSARGHMTPGFDSTPQRLQQETVDVHKRNASSASISSPSGCIPPPRVEHLISPSRKRQKMDSPEILSSHNRDMMAPPSVRNVALSTAVENVPGANMQAPVATASTGKKKRKKQLVKGF